MIVVIMGVSGSGKTTIGQMLAQRLKAHFFDADDYHSAEHIAQMHRGIPLTDEERIPWLAKLNELLRVAQERNESAILACSALKSEYRDTLLRGIRFPKLVYLRGSPALIASRIAGRAEHFMNPQLLDSQFDALEEPQKGAIVADVSATPQSITTFIQKALSAE